MDEMRFEDEGTEEHQTVVATATAKIICIKSPFEQCYVFFWDTPTFIQSFSAKAGTMAISALSSGAL